jgi:hypothetical protein
MDDVIKDLERRKKMLDKDKQEYAEAIGSEKELFKQANTEFGLDNLDAMKEKYKELAEQNDAMKMEIEEDHSALQENFKW